MRPIHASRKLLWAIKARYPIAAALVGCGVCASQLDGWQSLIWLTLGGFVVMFVVEALLLRKQRERVATLLEIERQLGNSQTGTTNQDSRLTPIDQTTAAAGGWNRLVKDTLYAGVLRRLETSVASKLTHNDQGVSDAILDSLGEGVAVTDLNDQLLIVNEALNALVASYEDDSKLEGLRIEELLRSIPGIESTEDIPSGEASMRPFAMELRGEEQDSHILRCSRRPHFDDANQHIGFVWTVRDVTQQRLAESTREEFVSMATHELRTPLANIRAYAETMAISDGIDVEQQKSFCNTILTEANRLSRFVDDLLDITRMQAGSLTLDRRESDLHSLFEEACAKIAGQVQSKQIRFDSDIPDKLPKLEIDKEKILATVVNLLGNAVKYTGDGGTVRLQVESQDGFLAIGVEDSGIGISEEELPQVFDKFFRSDDERVREESGSGLGLAFALEVSRLHGGDIEVQSELDKGTKFLLKLPVSQEALV